jgi:HD-GYP domain-containing protein (c-di-GMP phosphodiesterase class II)
MGEKVMSMKRQSIRHKFFIFFIVVSILSVVLAMEYSYSSTSQREYNEYVSLAIRMDGMIDQMRIKYFLDRIESFSDREYLESSQKLINTAESEILNRYTEELHEQFGESIVAKVEELEQDFNFIKNLFQNELYRDDTVDEIQMYFDALDDSNTEVKKEIIIEIRELIDKTQIIIDWTLFLLIFVCVVFIATLNKEIMKPLKWMTKQLEKQSEIDGKFYEPISIDVKNEMGYFINAYNQLAKTNLAMHQLNEKIYAQNSFDEIMKFIFESFKPFIPYNRIGIAVLTHGGESIKALKAKSDRKIYLGSYYKENLKENTLGQLIEENKPRIINDLDEYLKNHPDSNSTKLIVKEGMKASLTLPLIVDRKIVGVIFFSSVEKDIYKERHILFLKNIANSVALAFEKNFIHEDLVLATVEGLAKVVESKDNITGDHIYRIGRYSKFISEKLLEDEVFDLNEKFVEDIFKFAPLHDIGKVSIADDILNKPGRLTDEEFEIMKEHSEIGYRVLREMTTNRINEEEHFFEMAENIARYHHEKYDGSGYPLGLKAEQIPLEARIVAIADVFDALVSKRPYKDGFSFEKAFLILENGKNNHFDPHIIETIVDYKAEFEKIYRIFKY